jgi:hypothetical protein
MRVGVQRHAPAALPPLFTARNELSFILFLGASEAANWNIFYHKDSDN